MSMKRKHEHQFDLDDKNDDDDDDGIESKGSGSTNPPSTKKKKEINRLEELTHQAVKKIKKVAKKKAEKKEKKETWKNHAQQSQLFIGMDLSKNSPSVCVWNVTTRQISILAVCRSRLQLNRWKQHLALQHKTEDENEDNNNNDFYPLATPVSITFDPNTQNKKKKSKKKHTSESYQVSYALFDKESFGEPDEDDEEKEDKDEKKPIKAKECQENARICQAWENAFQVLDTLVGSSGWKQACVMLEGYFVDDATRSASILPKIHGVVGYMLWKRDAQFHILAPTTIKSLFVQEKGGGKSSKHQMWSQFQKVTDPSGLQLTLLHPGVPDSAKVPNPHQDIVDAFAICYVARFV
jgi:Holliday junction resolvasome RuvABC endonuclease subunit